MHAAQLPRVASERPGQVIGKDTVDGDAVRRLLGLCRPDRGPGGAHQGRVRQADDGGPPAASRSLFEGATASIDHFDPDLPPAACSKSSTAARVSDDRAPRPADELVSCRSAGRTRSA